MPTVPPAALQPGLRLLRRFVFNPDIPIPRQRARMEAAVRATVFTPFGTSVDRVTIGGVPGLRVACGAVGRRRLVVHLHGGAFCIGSPTMAKAFAARLSKMTNAAVFVPDYRLAPEHPYPAALEDVLAVLSHPGSEQAVTATPATYRPSRPDIALTGDSAGAALAVAACRRMRGEAGPVPVSLGLVCPLLDLTDVRAPLPGDPLLTPEWVDSCGRAYTAAADPAHPEISPLRGSLSGLPPAFVVSASGDLLAPDAQRFAAAVAAAGGTAVHHHVDGLWHDFPLHAGLLRRSDEAVDALGAFLCRAFEQGGRHPTEATP